MDEDDSDSSFNSERDGESSVEGSGDDDFIQLDTTLGKKCFRDGVLNSDLSPVYVVLLIFLILSLCKKLISVCVTLLKVGNTPEWVKIKNC